MADIRKASVKDAPKLVTLFKKLDEETTFMLFEPGERVLTADQQTQRLKQFENSHKEVMFVAENDVGIVGFVIANGGGASRNRHSAHIVIGVLKDYWNRGLGRALMQSVETWARGKHMHRLELTVIDHNTNAIALYEKCGFEQEGVKRDSIRLGDHYVNEFYMSKLI